jgi:TatD DNase family protein
MIFADTHAHLYLEDFDRDRDEMIRRALNAGVRYLFLPNIDQGSIGDLLRMVKSFPDRCFPMMGLHPTSVGKEFPLALKVVEEELEKNRKMYCAVGEIGIDLYWDKKCIGEQKAVFLRQIELCSRYDLPAVIHTRNSFDLVASLIEEEGKPGLKGIFHCFSGEIEQARRAVKLGFLLGIGGVVTFKKSGLQKVVQAIPLEHLVLETDAPYLAPVPFRGERNESSYIPVIARKIAEIKDIPLSKVAETTTSNALNLFQIANY